MAYPPASNPFSASSIHQALQDAVLNDMVPTGKTTALLVTATTDGLKAYLATKLDDHWQIGAGGDWHYDGHVSAGVQLVASW